MLLQQFLRSLRRRTPTPRRRSNRIRTSACRSSAEQLEQRSLLTTLTVTTRFDLMDPNDGVLSLREALAAAADEQNHPGPDTITFSTELGSGMIHADYGGFTTEFDSQLGKYVLREWFAPNSGGEFVIESDVTIDGSAIGLARIGHERGWAERHRIFRVNAGVTATFRNVVVQGGDSSDADGGGIWNAGDLTIEDSVIGGNYALSTRMNARGGGIFNSATGRVTLKNAHIGEVALTGDFLNGLGVGDDFYLNEEASERTRYGTAVYRGEAVVGKATDDPTQISGNGSAADGGGIYNLGELHVTQGSVIRANRAHDGRRGGGVFNAGTMVLEDSVIEDQVRFNADSVSAPAGAGIWNAGILRVARSVFRNNVTNRDGGAIYNAGTLFVEDTRFEDNAAIRNTNQTGLPDPRGGAIFDAGTQTTLVRSSLVRNTAGSVDGDVGQAGAIYVDGNAAVTLDRVTIAKNEARDVGGLLIDNGEVRVLNSTIAFNSAVNQAGGIRNSGRVVLRNAIVGQNTALNETGGRDLASSGDVVSWGHNLIEDETGFIVANGSQPTDQLGTLAGLAPTLARSNTVGLRPNSLAVDSGAGADVARHDYRLDQSLQDANDGPVLVAHGGVITADGYTFAAGQGLTLQGGYTANDQYSIELQFRIDSLNPPFKKLIDFKNLTTDQGLYVTLDGLQFYNETHPTAQVITADTDHHLVLTRNRNTSEVVAFVDGTEVLRFFDFAGQAVFDAGSSVLHVFRDDAVTHGTESVGGVVRRLRVYDQILTAGEIAALAADLDAFDGRSVTDQRGETGSFGRRPDRGAFESRPPATMRVDSLADTSDGDYSEGEFTLREAIEWANGTKDRRGPDEIAFAPDLVAQLQETPGVIELSLGELQIQDDLAIYGPGADLLTISGQNLSRIFHVTGSAVDVSGLTLTGGRAAHRGGAIYNEGDLTVRDLHVTQNAVKTAFLGEAYGGGIANYGTITIESSTIDHNTAEVNGGGVYNWGDATLINSTVSSNSANFGGGVWTGVGNLTVQSSTIVDNDAAVRGGGFRRTPASGITINNSIIAGNTSPDGPDGRTDPQEAIPGSHNVIGIGDAAGFTDGVNNNQVGSAATPLDPLIGKLRKLGGPTPVHGLLPGSPALEAANPANFPRFDQRGVARPVDVLPDIGAFEYVAPTLTSPVVVDSLNGDSDGEFGPGEMSLTEAILFTNADPALTSIVFDSSLFADGPQTIQLAGTELDITGDVVINGPGADQLEIRGAGTGFRVFDVLAASARIRDLTISGGNAYNAQVPFGGGVNNYGDTILERVFLTDHTAQYGGAIYNNRFSSLIVRDSTIAGSSAFWGGGLLNNGEATLINVTVTGNSNIVRSWSRGAGIYSDNSRPDLPTGSQLTLIHTTVTGNSGVQGGGIYSEADSFLRLGNTLIAGNTATDGSPDIHDDNSHLTSLGGNIVGNNDGLAASLLGSDQFGTSSTPLSVPMTDLVIIGDAAMPMHGLLPDPHGSPAINRGVAANGIGTDQRGVTRPFDGGYDVGAFEIGAGDALNFDFENEIVVDDLSDVMDAYYGPGGMTLREAALITSVFDASAPTILDGVAYDRIRFSETLFEDRDGSSAEILLTRGQLEFHGPVIVETTSPDPGPGTPMPRVRIDANQSDRVLKTHNGAAARLSDLIITGGVAAGPHHLDQPGGGISAGGDLWLTRVDVVGNMAEYSGGGIHTSNSDIRLKDVVISGNSAPYGGGVSVEGGNNLTVIGSSVFDNQAATRGGGIDAIGGLTIRNSTIHDNSSSRGGGIFTYFGPGLIENSTISGNSAGTAGGIGRSSGDTLRLINTTIADNTATTQGGGIENSGRVEFANTILADNHAPTGPDGFNTYRFVSLGHNIFGNTTEFANPGGIFGGGSFTSGPGDQLNTDPVLEPLGDYGGPTLTHPLNPVSPAIDAGGARFTPLMDQRGFPVTNIPGVGTDVPDIGSYEIQSVSSSPWRYEALGRSQFGPGQALSFGFGYDDGKDGNDVRTDPYFLGFEFDTGRMKFGDIVDGPFGTKFGGEVNARFAGKLGFDIGFYVNSGSVDVAHFGDANYVIDPGANGSAVVSTYIDVNDGGMYTVSPKIGAWADLVVKLDADVSARAALFGVIGADLIDIHVNNRTEMFSLNRQMEDRGRPLFLTDSGEPVARDSKTGKFYDLSVVPQEIPDPGLIIPLLDGDIRYFSLGIEEVAQGVIESAKTARELVNYVRAVRELNDANADAAQAQNEKERLNKRLDKASEESRRSTSLNAQQELTDLAGPEYAAAVAQGKKGDELPEKQGNIREADDSLVSAKRRQDQASGKVRKQKSRLLKRPGVGVVVDTGMVTGNLLGAEVRIGVGASLGLASVTKNVGSMQVTLPDVNLRDNRPDELGALSASTSDFRRNSAEDLKRQIAKAQIDLGAFIPGFPGGSYEVGLGPLSLDVTTVSYNVGPQLNVTQDVQARPVKVDQGLTYTFFESDGTTPESVQVTINGTPWADGALVQQVSFNEGDRVEILGSDDDGDGQPDPVIVRPTLTIGSEFSNDIGLDIDLDGAFRAFGLSLSAFGETFVEVGPLLQHSHTFHTFDLGSVFNKTFGLGTETLPLEPFTLFDGSDVGRTPATAVRTQPSAANADVSEATLTADEQVPLFVTVDQRDESDADRAFTVLDIESVSGGTIDAVEVLDDRLTVSGGTDGTPFRISGYTAELLEEQGAAVFAVRFEGDVTDAVIRATRSQPISLSAARSGFGSDSALMTRRDFERVGSRAVLNNDIDGDGLTLPETDGILMIRHLAGFSGEALVTGALGSGATRTDPDEIAAFIEETLDQALPPTQYGNTASTLDFDGDGGSPTALGDGVLFARYLDGRRGGDLVGGVVPPDAERQTSDAVVRFIEVGRASASDPEQAEFDKVRDRRGFDIFGLDGKRDADPDAVPGSSSTAAIDGSFAGGGFANNGSQGPAFEFDLSAWGQSIDFEELYIDTISPENLVSRIAVGSPTDFGSEEYEALINDGGSTVPLQKQTVSSTLGIDEPIFVRAPDAGGYEYEASPGHTFTGVTIDPQVGGNIYQSAAWDLYLYNSVSEQWEFDRLLTVADAAQVTRNGDLQFEFSGNGVSRFRLYSLAFRNQELHDDDNLEPPVVEFRTGFTLQADVGQTGTPTVRMTQLAERQAFDGPVSVTVVDPVHASDPAGDVTSTFTVRRDLHSQQVTAATTGIGVVPEPASLLVGSTEEIRIEGHDLADDVVVLQTEFGPLRIPLNFLGGFGSDELHVQGADAVVDLVDRSDSTEPADLQQTQAIPVTLSEVDVVDLRGAGNITLLVDVAAVLDNNPWTRELRVRRDADDSVPIAAGWESAGTAERDGITWDRYIAGRATLLVEHHSGGGGFSQVSPSQGESENFAGPEEPADASRPQPSPALAISPHSPRISLFPAAQSPDTSQWMPSLHPAEPESAETAGQPLSGIRTAHAERRDSVATESDGLTRDWSNGPEQASLALLDDVFASVGELLQSELAGVV